MSERVSGQTPAQPEQQAPVPAGEQQTGLPPVFQQPEQQMNTLAGVPQTPAQQPATPLEAPKRHYVHHSYIWLGSLRMAGVVIFAIVVSAFSSLAGILFDDSSASGGAGFGIFVAGLSSAIGIAVIFAACVLYQWWSYRHLWYEIGEEEFSLYSGIFNKKRVHVPYQRVQSVDQNASLWQRIFGVCTVSIDTAGGSSHTAVRVPYLRKDQAERLRMELYLRKRRILGLDTAASAPMVAAAAVSAAAPVAAPGATLPGAAQAPAFVQAAASGAAVPSPLPVGQPQQPGNILDVGAEVWDDMRGVFAGDAVYMGQSSYEYCLTNKELVFTGLSNNTGFVLAIIGVLATVFQVVGGVMDVVGDAAGAVANTAYVVGSSIFGGNLVLLGIVACIVVVVALWAISVAGTCIQYGGFKARRRGNRIEVEHGLLQHHIRGVDVDRVQSVVIKQSVVRRFLGYCELSLGKIDANDSAQGDQGQSISQQGLVIHPFVRLDRVPEILAGIIPEFADIPAKTTPLACVALRRGIVRRGILQGAGFWLAVIVAVSQVLVNLLWHPVDPVEQAAFSYLNIGFFAAYAVCAIVFALEVVGAVLWARGSGFAYNRHFMRVVNGGMAREIVSFPRRKMQFGYTSANPFQRRARTVTIAARTAAGTGGTTVKLIDVCEDDAQAWLEWVRPRANAVR